MPDLIFILLFVGEKLPGQPAQPSTFQVFEPIKILFQ